MGTLMCRMFLLALAFLMLCGVRTSSAYSEKECDAKAWIKLPSAGVFSVGESLDSAHVLPITGKMKRLAIDKLKKTSFYRVRANELRSLRTNKFLHRMQAFFVRGVAYNVANGTWALKIVGDMLYVGHDSLGPAALPLRCEPILVFLDRAPKEIFVRAGIDQ